MSKPLENEMKAIYKTKDQLITDGFSSTEAEHLSRTLDLWITDNGLSIVDGAFETSPDQLNDFSLMVDPEIADFGFINVVAMLDAEYTEGEDENWA
jgi:hypothetical protein